MERKQAMIVEQAVVIDYQNGIAKVQCYAKSGCGSCMAKSSCGTTALSALAGEKTAPQIELAVAQPLIIGDKIEIGLPDTRLLNGLFWVYAIPLIVLISSIILLSNWIENELWVALGGFLCTLVSFFGVKYPLARQQFHPIFLRKV